MYYSPCSSDLVETDSSSQKVTVSVSHLQKNFLLGNFTSVFADICNLLQVWQWQDDNQLWRDYDQDAQLVIEV